MFKVIEKHAAQMLAQGNTVSVGLSPASHLLKKTLLVSLGENNNNGILILPICLSLLALMLAFAFFPEVGGKNTDSFLNNQGLSKTA